MPEITTTLFGAERLKNSRSGNPRYSLWTSAGAIHTRADASVNYDVDNFTRGIDPENPPRVVISTTTAGRAWAMRYADGVAP